MQISKQDFDKNEKQHKREIAEREIDLKRMMGILSSLLDLFSDKESPEDLTWALENISEKSLNTIISRCAEGASLIELLDIKYSFGIDRD